MAMSDSTLLLKSCERGSCEGMCCYDGVYLRDGEEAFLLELLDRVPRLRKAVPEPMPIVDGYWEGKYFGRKTAVRPVHYKNPDFPEHFTRTRCVFSDAEGLCELEKFARNNHQHPWAYKPLVCWLAPLTLGTDNKPVAPPCSPELDTYRTKEYPGFITFVPCGKHNSNGSAWEAVLSKEIEYLASFDELPTLGSASRRLDDLLKSITT